jgi:hypothetical protein
MHQHAGYRVKVTLNSNFQGWGWVGHNHGQQERGREGVEGERMNIQTEE